MAFHKQDDWWRLRSAVAGEDWPADLACITADGRQYDRSRISKLVSAGPDVWNNFKRTLPPIRWYRTKGGPKWIPGFALRLRSFDFSGADLSAMDFTGCDLSSSNFARATLQTANLSGSGLHRSFEASADLSNSNFRRAKLISMEIGSCDLSQSIFTNAELNGVHFHLTDLQGATFQHCMIAASFHNVKMRGADFADAHLMRSEFIDTDLGGAKNLSSMRFHDHTVLDHRTLFKSGRLPDAFYRGCGLPEVLVQYMPSIVNDPIQFESCFISHSSKDEIFVTRLYRDLQDARVRCFFAPKDLKIGSIIRDDLDSAIHVNDRLLLILSCHSIGSQWVEHEVEAALERERKEGRLVLFPIMIDDSVMTSSKGWAANLRRQRTIGDFRKWKDSESYYGAFQRLLNDLPRGEGPQQRLR